MLQFREDIAAEVLTELGLEPEDDDHPLGFVRTHAKGKRSKKPKKAKRAKKEKKKKKKKKNDKGKTGNKKRS